MSQRTGNVENLSPHYLSPEIPHVPWQEPKPECEQRAALAGYPRQVAPPLCTFRSSWNASEDRVSHCVSSTQGPLACIWRTPAAANSPQPMPLLPHNPSRPPAWVPAPRAGGRLSFSATHCSFTCAVPQCLPASSPPGPVCSWRPAML